MDFIEIIGSAIYLKFKLLIGILLFLWSIIECIQNENSGQEIWNVRQQF
jgi:hypothetical protein